MTTKETIKTASRALFNSGKQHLNHLKNESNEAK